MVDSGARIVQDLATVAWSLNAIVPSYGPNWVWGCVHEEGLGAKSP